MSRRGCISILALGLIAATPASAEGWRDKVTAFAVENLKHPAWGFSHSQRDYDLAKSLAAADHVTLDDDVIFAAAYLHDMAAFEAYAVPKQDHSDTAAEKIERSALSWAESDSATLARLKSVVINFAFVAFVSRTSFASTSVSSGKSPSWIFISVRVSR